MIGAVTKGKGPQEISTAKKTLTWMNRYRDLERDDDTDDEEEHSVNHDFLDGLVKLALGPITVQDEFKEVVF